MDSNDYKQMVKNNLNNEKIHFEEGKMNEDDIQKCEFNGVYAIFDDDNLIYIGSAYASKRTVSIRLNQYLGISESGNTLANAIVKSHYNKITSFNRACEFIKELSFIAFEHIDIEYYLINNSKGLINTLGNKK